MSNELLIEVEGNILILSINRPESRNAMNKGVAEQISSALDRLDSDDSLSIAILTGANNNFCSGMDLKGYLRGESPVIPGRGFGGLTERVSAKPIIAAVEGYALAGGFELVLSCDLVVAGKTAKFGIPEVKRGLVAGAGGLIRLPRQLPQKIALEMALTGDFISAERALSLGLINRVSDDGRALSDALELATKIAANGPLATKVSKQIIYSSFDWPLEEIFERQKVLTQPVFSSEDAKEGARAFAEKRSPVWKGK